MMHIDIEKLIKVVKKHRVLYDSKNKEYYDRVKRKQVWDIVCSQLSSRWETWDDGQKLIYCKEVQKKWQSLRDCFRRDLTIQKSDSLKKKYKYFDALEFLTPHTHSSHSMSDTRASSPEDVSILVTDQDSNSKDPLSEPNLFQRKLSVTFEAESVEKNIEEVATTSRRYLDDDEAFLYSLLPSFKEYGTEQKYLLRIELMKTILKFRRSQNYCSVVKEENNEEEHYYS